MKLPYYIGTWDGAPFITCLTCGLTSHNQHDVKARYCGRCHLFLDWDFEENYPCPSAPVDTTKS